MVVVEQRSETNRCSSTREAGAIPWKRNEVAVHTESRTTTVPSQTVAERRPAVSLLGAASLVVAGLSLAVYALTGFTAPDWTVAGPGLLVAAAGIAGLRTRWFHLAGLVPIAALLTVAGPILAYDLARPDETPYFVGSVIIVVSTCAAAIFGVASTIEDRRSLPVGLAMSLAVTPIVVLAVVGASPSSADASDGIVDAARAAAVDVEMIDTAFVVAPSELRAGTVVRLRNTGTLPHDFTIRELDVAVFVPSGRTTYVRLPDASVDTFELICTVGDHLELGMQIAVVPG